MDEMKEKTEGLPLMRRGRGRPKKEGGYKRPKCETEFLKRFTDNFKIYYPSTDHVRAKYGIMVFKYDQKTIGIVRFTESLEGDIYWGKRFIKKTGGGVMYCYDLIKISVQNATEVGSAVIEGMKRWFGGDAAAVEIIKPFVQKKEEDKTKADLKKIGGLF